MALFRLSDPEHSAVMCALRILQETLDAHKPPDISDDLEMILTNGDNHPAITPDEIDDLCMRLNTENLTFADCIYGFASPEDDPHIIAARSTRHQEGVLEIGEPTIASGCPGGAYVMAWVWVETPEHPDTDSLTMPLDFAPPPTASKGNHEALQDHVQHHCRRP